MRESARLVACCPHPLRMCKQVPETCRADYKCNKPFSSIYLVFFSTINRRTDREAGRHGEVSRRHFAIFHFVAPETYLNIKQQNLLT